MIFSIRQEKTTDYQTVFNLIEYSFKDVKESNRNEHHLVERLRKSDAFIEELSLVAESNGKIIGYILMTKVEIVSEKQRIISLGLAPVVVHPQYQRQGIGSALIREAHKRAIELGYGSAVLIGHKNYYPRLGYKKAIDLGIELPFDIPHDYCMVVELKPNALHGIHGTVKYSKPFMK